MNKRKENQMNSDKVVEILNKVNEIVDYAVENDGHTSQELYSELIDMLKKY